MIPEPRRAPVTAHATYISRREWLDSLFGEGATKRLDTRMEALRRKATPKNVGKYAYAEEYE